MEKFADLSKSAPCAIRGFCITPVDTIGVWVGMTLQRGNLSLNITTEEELFLFRSRISCHFETTQPMRTQWRDS